MTEEERSLLTDLSDRLIALYTERDAAQSGEHWGTVRRLETQIVETHALRQRLVAEIDDE